MLLEASKDIPPPIHHSNSPSQPLDTLASMKAALPVPAPAPAAANGGSMGRHGSRGAREEDLQAQGVVSEVKQLVEAPPPPPPRPRPTAHPEPEIKTQETAEAEEAKRRAREAMEAANQEKWLYVQKHMQAAEKDPLRQKVGVPESCSWCCACRGGCCMAACSHGRLLHEQGQR